MKTKNGIICLLIIAVLIGFMSSANAWGRDGFNKEKGWGKPPATGRNPMEGKHPVEGLARMLNLTPEQKTKLVEQNQALEREILPVQQKIGSLRMKMEEEMSKDKPDHRVIENYVKEIGQNRATIQMKRIDFLLKFRESLSPEQRSKLKRPRQR
jgi:Spy/CpxP family protein refolding chaperone